MKYGYARVSTDGQKRGGAGGRAESRIAGTLDRILDIGGKVYGREQPFFQKMDEPEA